MALIPFRANTQSSFIPLLSRQSSQTIISNEIDQTYVPNVNPQDSTSPVERGIPQILYGHNIMPSTFGYQSVGYLELYKGIKDNVHIDEVFLVISREKARTYIAVDYTVKKAIYVLDTTGKWVLPNNPAGWVAVDVNRKISVANIRGESIIHIPGFGSVYYSESELHFHWITLVGLDQPAIEGLVSAAGYLIAWSKTGYSWSASNDPYDFTPSIITGAGGGDLEYAAGPITHCQSTALGFMVYTTNNCVGVIYSGNDDYPFNPRPVASAGGLKNHDYVCVESAATQYAYTSNGLQTIGHTGAKTVMPAITDFLAGQLIEDYDDDLQEFILREFDAPMKKKFALVCDRYLICSYGDDGQGNMTHALAIDIINSRLGKLRVKHTACFEHRNTTPEQDETPRRSIAFIDKTGKTSIVDFNVTNENSKGTVIFGKYQLLRQNFVKLERVEVENVDTNCKLTLLGSYNGKDFTRKVAAYRDEQGSEGLLSAFHCDFETKNISLLFQGQFELNGLVMYFQLGGSN